MRWVLACIGAAVAVACSVDAVQLTGRLCPCVAGWVCDSTNHCVLPDAALPDAQGSDGGTLIFDEEFDGGTLDPNKWVTAGNGNWSIQGGFGEQTSGGASEALIYAKSFTSATDYHIVARMHSTGPFDAGNDLAPEVCFRTDPSVLVTSASVPETFHCNVDLLTDDLLLQHTDQSPGTFNQTAFAPPSSAGVWFVIDVVAKGSSVTCTATVDGVGQVATVSFGALPRLTGSFGLKTYDTAAEFAYFRVYTP